MPKWISQPDSTLLSHRDPQNSSSTFTFAEPDPQSSRPSVQSYFLEEYDEPQDKNVSTIKNKFFALNRQMMILTREACRSLSHQKFSCFAAGLSVFLVVLAATLLSSLSSYASIVITRLAELQMGEADVVITPKSTNNFINLTNMKQAIKETTYVRLPEYFGVEKSFAPRLDFSGAVQAITCEAEPVSKDTCRESPTYRGEVLRARTMLYDHNIEKKAQIGVVWPHPPLPTGNVYMTAGLMQHLSLKENNYVGLSIDLGVLLKKVLRRSVNAKESLVTVPVRVRKALNSFHGKFRAVSVNEGEELPSVFGEFSHFFKDALSFSNLTTSDMEKLQKHRLQDTVSSVLIRIPTQRAEIYYDGDFARVQRRVIHFATDLLRDLSLASLKIALPLLQKLDEHKFLALFIGLIVQVIIVVFAFLCFILLYSHMTFAVELKHMQMGILRLLGLTRRGVACLTLTEITIIAIPSWGIALLASNFVFRMVANIINSQFGATLPGVLSTSSIFLSGFVGLALPLLASLLPVRQAMASRPLDAFSWRRTRASAVVISKHTKDGLLSPGSMIAAGLMSLYGIIIFISFPRAMIKMDMQSLVYLFEVFIVSILFGMVLFLTSFDLQACSLLKNVLFFYERRSVHRISKLNLITHRTRNRKTFVMYSISVALVIYIQTSLHLQLQTVLTIMKFHTGATYRVSPRISRDLSAFDCCKQKLEELSDLPGVSSFTWVSETMPKFLPQGASLMNVGGAFSTRLHAQAVLPSYLGSIYNGIYRGSMKSGESWNNVDFYEELYTVKGSQSIVVHKSMREVLGSRGQNTHLAARISYRARVPMDAPTKSASRLATVKEGSSLLSILAEYGGLPGFHKNKYSKHHPSLVSFPTYTRLIGGRYPYVDKLPLAFFLLHVNTPSGKSGPNLAKIRQALDSVRGTRLEVESVEETADSIEAASNLLQFGFLGINGLVLTVCFFALLTGMIANARESRKETAVLRAIGIREHVLFRVILVEALSILMGASAVGTATGWAVSQMQHYQQSLFLDLNSSIHVPWVTFVTTIVASLISSIISAALSSRLGKHTISMDLSKV